MKTTLRNKLAIGIICLASTFVGFGLGYNVGQKTQEVDFVSVHNEGDYNSNYKAIRFHKVNGRDQVFVSMNRDRWQTYEKNYFPIRDSIETSYGKSTDFSKRRINDVFELVGITRR